RDNGFGQSTSRGRIGRSECAVFAGFQPVGNTADGKGHRRHAVATCFWSHESERLGPQAREDQQMRRAKKLVELPLFDPARKGNVATASRHATDASTRLHARHGPEQAHGGYTPPAYGRKR